MKIKVKRIALVGVLLLVGVVFHGMIAASQAPQSTVRLITNPPHQLVAFEAEATTSPIPTELTLEAIDAKGQRLQNAIVTVQIFTPPKTPWFTSDFPIVEGTTLLKLSAIAPIGQLQFQQMFPIRGTYSLQVKVAPQINNAFEPFEQTLTLAFADRWVKYRNLAILLGILLLIGIGGGWVIGQRQQLGAGLPEGVRLLLSGLILVAIAVLLYVNISAEFASEAHHDHATATQANRPTVQQAGLQAEVSGETSATVGQPANLFVKIKNPQTQQPITDVRVNLKVSSEESGWIAFAADLIPDARGIVQWQEQFFDGAPHRVEATIAPLAKRSQVFQPFQITQTVDVEGVAPPLLVRLISLLYFVAILSVGFFLGTRFRAKNPFKARQIQG
jgi:hypothetical protein